MLDTRGGIYIHIAPLFKLKEMEKKNIEHKYMLKLANRTAWFDFMAFSKKQGFSSASAHIEELIAKTMAVAKALDAEKERQLETNES